MNKISWLVLLSTLSLSCSKHHPLEVQREPLKVAERGPEVYIPTKIWESLVPKGVTVDSFTFVPLKVLLTEKNPGVLQQKEILLEFPRGGGELDFSQYLGNRVGTFFIQFIFDDDSQVGIQSHFISNTKPRKVEGKTWGLGCGKYAVVNQLMDKEGFKAGLTANTFNLRHLSVYGGSFVFAKIEGSQLRMAQVSLKDSRYPEMFCDIKPQHQGNE
ncbi:MAG: hypothetical protein ACK5P6_12705 [Pseudobdellovibrionaceae bacterium]